MNLLMSYPFISPTLYTNPCRRMFLPIRLFFRYDMHALNNDINGYFSMSNLVFDTSLEQFDQDVLDASHQQPVLLDMWADWCPPCVVIAPILKDVVDEMEGAVKLAKLEVDDGDNMKIAGRYQVRGFPTIILFQHGEEKARFSGAKSKSYVIEFIEQNIS